MTDPTIRSVLYRYAVWLSYPGDDPKDIFNIISREGSYTVQAEAHLPYGGRIITIAVDFQGIGHLVAFTGLDDEVETIAQAFDGYVTIFATRQQPMQSHWRQVDGMWLAINFETMPSHLLT